MSGTNAAGITLTNIKSPLMQPESLNAAISKRTETQYISGDTNRWGAVFPLQRWANVLNHNSLSECFLHNPYSLSIDDSNSYNHPRSALSTALVSVSVLFMLWTNCNHNPLVLSTSCIWTWRNRVALFCLWSTLTRFNKYADSGFKTPSIC